MSYCDPAGKAANTQTTKTEFDVFAVAGLRPYGKSSGVRDGCVQIMNLLAQEEQPLVIASRCEGLIRALSQIKPHRANHEIYDKDHESSRTHSMPCAICSPAACPGPARRRSAGMPMPPVPSRHLSARGDGT